MSMAEYKASVEAAKSKGEIHLRANGWRYTSNTPGCYWLWERKIDGRVLLVDFEFALRIQERIEADKSYSDGPPSSRRPDNPDG